MKKDGQEGSPEYSTLSHKAEKFTMQIGGKGRIYKCWKIITLPTSSLWEKMIH